MSTESLALFIAQRDAFVLDGRLYYTSPHGQKGLASYVIIDVHSQEVLFIHRGRAAAFALPMMTQVTVKGDVATYSGGSGEYATDRTKHWAVPRPTTMKVWQMRRQRMVLLDNKLVKDTTGSSRVSKFTGKEITLPSSIAIIDEPMISPEPFARVTFMNSDVHKATIIPVDAIMYQLGPTVVTTTKPVTL